MAKAVALELKEEDRKELESIMRTPTIEARLMQRARILLLKADGLSTDAIADKVGIGRESVMDRVGRYKERGLEAALYDAAGRGRPAEITDSDKAWIISEACKKPKELGYSAEIWSYSKLTEHIHKTAMAAGHERLERVSTEKIRTILNEAEIKPFQIRYYCEKRDPDFEKKMHNVLVVYKHLSFNFDEDGVPVEKEEAGPKIHTVSYDEKPGIQAIATVAPDLPPTEKNGVIMRDGEYKRLGTVSLLAAIDLLTGEAIPHVSDSHKSSDFVQFLKKLDKKYPEGDIIRLILDNHSVHSSKETMDYLRTRPGRFQFIFTPKHGSWLNLIEGFFGKMTRQMLRGIRVESKEELIARIYKYFDEVNDVPVVYHWKYKLEEIKKDEVVKIDVAV